MTRQNCAFNALKSQLKLKVLGSDGKPISDPSFMALARAVCEAAYASDASLAAQAVDTFDHLNKVRVSFKHDGLSPDVPSSFHLFSAALEHLNAICSELIGIPLTDIHYAAAINEESIRDHLHTANEAIDTGAYKEALEAICLALFVGFRTLNVPSYIRPGDASSEDALLLSGRGIDPASFLTMQKLLPITYDGEEVKWELRKTGHPGNWTETNARFCYRTAISTIVRLQSAQQIPSADDFYDWYEDVVEIMVDLPMIYNLERIIGSDKAAELIGSFGKGEKIIGRAKGYWNLSMDGEEGIEIDLEDAPYIALSQPMHRLLPNESGLSALFDDHVLWFKKEDVAVSYQMNQWRRFLLEHVDVDLAPSEESDTETI
jgi:hypothetical protein